MSMSPLSATVLLLALGCASSHAHDDPLGDAEAPGAGRDARGAVAADGLGTPVAREGTWTEAPSSSCVEVDAARIGPDGPYVVCERGALRFDGEEWTAARADSDDPRVDPGAGVRLPGRLMDRFSVRLADGRTLLVGARPDGSVDAYVWEPATGLVQVRPPPGCATPLALLPRARGAVLVGRIGYCATTSAVWQAD